MKTKFVDLRPPRTTLGELLFLSIWMEVEPVQQGSGIVAHIGLSNNSTGPLSLLNPFELVQFHVEDESGRVLHLPPIVPSLLRGKGSKLEWRLEYPLPIVSVHKNGLELPVESLDKEVVIFEVGDEYRVLYEIDRHLEARPEGPVESSIADGSYTIEGLISIINANDKNESRVLESPQLQVKFKGV